VKEMYLSGEVEVFMKNRQPDDSAVQPKQLPRKFAFVLTERIRTG
jgi:hypothetical protein